MNKLCELVKFDLGLAPQVLNASNTIGRYFPLNCFRRAVMVLEVSSMADAATAKLELLQATDGSGNGSKTLSPAKEATITANVKASEVTLTLASVLAADSVTINGLTFTAHANTTTKGNREFAINGNDAADAAELAACINDPDYGVPGLLAEVAQAVITLKIIEPGKGTITVNNAAATISVATVAALAFVEVGHFDLDYEGGMNHIAAKVTTTGNSVISASLLRYDGREATVQAVAASN